MSWQYGAAAILGLAVVTFVTRGLFLFSERELRFPEPLQRALQVAPLAAIVAVVAPEIFLRHGELIGTWRDARLAAALAATLFYAWRPGVLGPLLAGLAAYLPLRLALGW
ncbi:MAG TPA: AzlD domain-containing protein [Caldimonas sp.]|nr:AzlD domain-containing protein [Caldimonas sp.]HEX2539898.1 AzlD domain-containing protein [Caldimonas sp.]